MGWRGGWQIVPGGGWGEVVKLKLLLSAEPADHAPTSPEVCVMQVQRQSVPDQVRRTLTERILAGQYQPGERLVELQIARELGVSQGSVREAFRELEAARLGGFFFVRRLDCAGESKSQSHKAVAGAWLAGRFK